MIFKLKVYITLKIFAIHDTQLFQPTATVATSWLEYTEEKSPPLELEVNPRRKSCELDTIGMFYLLANKYCRTINRHNLSFHRGLNFVLYLSMVHNLPPFPY